MNRPKYRDPASKARTHKTRQGCADRFFAQQCTYCSHPIERFSKKYTASRMKTTVPPAETRKPIHARQLRTPAHTAKMIPTNGKIAVNASARIGIVMLSLANTPFHHSRSISNNAHPAEMEINASRCGKRNGG